jgi:hypothetical protein
MLKQRLLALTLAGVVCTVMAPAVAQNSGSNDQQSAPAGAPPDQGHGRRHFDPEQRAEMLNKQLKLTSDQQPKVLEILKSEQSQMEKLRSDSSVSRDDRRSKMMDIHKSSNDQIRALLDADQQKKWDTMQSQREQWQGHHQEGQGPSVAPDSSEQK